MHNDTYNMKENILIKLMNYKNNTIAMLDKTSKHDIIFKYGKIAGYIEFLFSNFFLDIKEYSEYINMIHNEKNNLLNNL